MFSDLNSSHVTTSFTVLRGYNVPRYADFWAHAAEEARKRGEPIPPNPLHHRSPTTTFRHYVPPPPEDELS